MKRNLCLLAALVVSFTFITGCTKIQARVKIREANDFYGKEQYAEALKSYKEAKAIDPDFPDLDRMIGYCYIGLFQPEDASAENQRIADQAIDSLQTYLKARPDDQIARDALVNLFLNANRIDQAIGYFEEYLKSHPADLNAVKSIAALWAKKGDFDKALVWYRKITLLESANPEAFYTFGVVCYEKVAKDPPQDVTKRLSYIEQGKEALTRATQLKQDYFEAIVYLNLLYREQAKVETDPAKQQQLIATAETYRNRAMEIARTRKKTG
jgi:tetratricopeptide (TPR) repeat protein